LISSPAFLDPARGSPTLPELIWIDSMFFDLLQRSNLRDSGDRRVSTGWCLPKVDRIRYAVPQDVLWVPRLGLKGRRGDEETAERDWGAVDRRWRKSENKLIKNI
jgi:hypothetical protein